MKGDCITYRIFITQYPTVAVVKTQIDSLDNEPRSAYEFCTGHGNEKVEAVTLGIVWEKDTIQIL